MDMNNPLFCCLRLCAFSLRNWPRPFPPESHVGGEVLPDFLIESLTSFPTTATTADISIASLKRDNFSIVGGVAGPVFMPSAVVVSVVYVHVVCCGVVRSRVHWFTDWYREQGPYRRGPLPYRRKS